MKDVTIFKDFISPTEQVIIDETIRGAFWQFGNASLQSSDYESFWVIPHLEKNDFFSKVLLQKIANVTNESFEVERIYMNGQTATSQGNLHRDSGHENGRTFLIYCNKVWHPEWGGMTFFQNDEEMECFYPHPYSAIYFKHTIPHFATPISKNFKGLRVTLAFKLYKI